FEPSQAEPESDVLPLHHKAILSVKRGCFRFDVAKVGTFSEPTKFFSSFFSKKCCFVLPAVFLWAEWRRPRV
ncbi:MAG: hypothetical protein K2H94_02845, partial [Duncaniella sp.]|nr:hypothetical protein [Duncaniella sp.]